MTYLCATCDTRLSGRPDTRGGVLVDLVDPCPTCTRQGSKFVRVERVGAGADAVERRANERTREMAADLEGRRSEALRHLLQVTAAVEAAQRSLARPLVRPAAPEMPRPLTPPKPEPKADPPREQERSTIASQRTAGWPRRIRCAACGHLEDRTARRGSMPLSCPKCGEQLSPEMAA